VNGQDYLHVRINQVQSASYPDVFVMPVDLVVTIGGSPETVTAWNDERSQYFAVPVSGTPTALQFDPNQWILRTSASEVALRVGDYTGDDAVDEADFAEFELCVSGSGGQIADGCEPGDFDGDGDIDCTDYRQFVLAWTAPGDPPDLPPCTTGLDVPVLSTWGRAALGLLLLCAVVVRIRSTVGSARR